jgi:hypothetical protein
LQKQLSAPLGKAADALLEAFVLFVRTRGLLGGRRRRDRLLPEVFMVNVTGYAKKIEGRIPLVTIGNFPGLEDHAIDGFIRKVLRAAATAADKYLYQPALNIPVFFAGPIGVGM